ncbi:MAG: hypothetical protein ACFCUI_01195 [Bernardetiaceae bacterium]
MKTNPLYAALSARYEADMKAAIAQIECYFTGKTMAAPGADLLDTLNEQFEKLIQAEEKLEALEDFFNEDGTALDYEEDEDDDDEDESIWYVSDDEDEDESEDTID